MRPIKFRAWLKELNEMRDVKSIVFNETYSFYGDVPQHVTVEGWCDIFPLDEIELMQFTGLLDRNGVEIYEGDIVHWVTAFTSPLDMRTRHKIDSNKKVHQKEDGKWVMGESGNTLYKESENVEIIGNIWEDGDLLDSE